MKRNKNATTNLGFKRWSRKGFGIFNSIGKSVKICVLTLSCSLVAIPAKTKAQQLDTNIVEKTLEIEEFTITADRTPVELSRTAKMISIIHGDELKRHANSSNEQALRGIASIDVRQRGGMGIQSDVSIRGGHYEQSIIMLNGIYFNDPQTGHFNLNLPIDFESINRIEVLQGSATRVYGANALSGIVNFITQVDTSNFVKLSAMGGQYGLYKTTAVLNYNFKNTTHYLSFSRFASDGYIENSDFFQNNAFYFGNIDAKKIKVDFQAGYNQREFGATNFYSPLYPNQFEANNTALASIKAETKTKIVISPSIYWRTNSDRFELIRGMKEAPSWYTKHNYHQSQMYGAKINSWYQSKLGKSTIGVDYRQESILSTVLGNALAKPIPIRNENLDYTKSYHRDYTSLFIDHEYYHQKFNISAGVMANYNTDLKTWNYFPGMDATVLLFPKVSLFASANSSMRMPTFTDLFYKSATLIGNENLKPEKAITYETGLKYINTGIQLQIALFERQGKNLIDWIKYPQDSLWRSENHTAITFRGFEFVSNLKPSKIIESLTFIDNIGISYTYLDINKNSQGFESAYVLDQLKHKVATSVSFNITSRLLLSYRYIYQDRNGQFLKYNIADGSSELTDYEAFSISDIRLMWQEKKWNAFVEANNIFDKKYYDIGNITQAGRWVKAGVSVKIAW